MDDTQADDSYATDSDNKLLWIKCSDIKVDPLHCDDSLPPEDHNVHQDQDKETFTVKFESCLSEEERDGRGEEEHEGRGDEKHESRGDEEIVPTGTESQARGCGGRRGAMRGRRGRPRGSHWRRGDRLAEVCVTDDDVPLSTRDEIYLTKGKRVARKATECFGANESGDAALFSEDKSALRFDWRPMDTFRGQRETFLPQKTGATTSSKCAYDAFSQFWDEGILTHIATETNRYATTAVCGRDWYDTNMHEILVLFSFWMMLAIIPMPSIKSCFSTQPLLRTSCFRRMFSRERYQQLCSALHFTDNSLRTPSSSRLFPIEPILTHLNARFQAAYIPRQEICIDESLTLWKGKLSFKQYIKTKAARYGIKTYELCETATGYLWSFLVYTGSDCLSDSPFPASLTKKTSTVLNLVRPLLNQGYTLFLDNWFNSPMLARYLKKNKTDVVGTLRLNCPYVPPLLSLCILREGQFLARHCDDVTVMAYHDKKKIGLISTYHSNETSPASSNTRQVRRWKPQLVLDYNKGMGGVDLKDRMLDPYLLERKRSMKWNMKLFKRLLNISILNSRICVESSSGTRLKHINFRLELVEEILKKHLNLVPRPRRPAPPPAEAVVIPRSTQNKHWPSTIRKRDANGRTMRRKCAQCKRNCTFQCDICDVGLCADTCFGQYHT